MEEETKQLKWLIEGFEEENEKLDQMIDCWNKYDDPGSDPGLQYMQGKAVKKAYNKIIEFAKTLR